MWPKDSRRRSRSGVADRAEMLLMHLVQRIAFARDEVPMRAIRTSHPGNDAVGQDRRLMGTTQ